MSRCGRSACDMHIDNAQQEISAMCPGCAAWFDGDGDADVAVTERDEAVRLLRALLNENCVATRTDGWALIDRIASVKP